MSAAAKDLKYYLEHTDEMPTDPKEIERLANAHMEASLESGTETMNVDAIVGKQEGDTKGEPPVAAEAAKEAEAKADPKTETPPVAQTPPESPKSEEKPEGILAKDGKNVIPYSQLESARSRASAAEALAREQAAEIERLKAEKAAPQEDVAILTNEELDALEADSPTLAKTLRAQQQSIQRLNERLEAVAQTQLGQIATEETAVRSEVQTAIDENPTLAAWQTAEDQSLWNEASRFDKLLRESPAYANVSFADRFAKVVELTQSALGLEAETPPAVVEEKPTLTPEQVKSAAQAKLTAKAKLPVSSSQFPGGVPPAVDEKDRVEQMSSVELGNKFLGMSREQLDTYLSTL